MASAGCDYCIGTRQLRDEEGKDSGKVISFNRIIEEATKKVIVVIERCPFCGRQLG